MLLPSLAQTTDEFTQILALQQENLTTNISDAERQSQGFVTMRHDLRTLQEMNDLAPAVIIKDDDHVVAYALSMLVECRLLMPALEPMFELFEKLSWQNKPLRLFNYYVMGQICVAKKYRGQGLVEILYDQHKKKYSSRFDLILTEISVRNQRSMKAHERIGFQTIHIHKDALDDWAIVGWGWK